MAASNDRATPRACGHGVAARAQGLRARLTTLALLALAPALSGAACTSPGDDPGLPVPVEPAVIYAQMCARCHGADGRGDAQIRQQLPVRDFTDPVFLARAGSEDIARVIMAGKGQMPSFGGMLSQPKIQSLSGYVRRLGKGAAIR
ncbi:MAG TPA: c-type cytochrome [Polyangia bacterium]|nr:c-type cytochrome [Polyangia bacterium]